MKEEIKKMFKGTIFEVFFMKGKWEFLQASFWVILVIGVPILLMGELIGDNIFLGIFAIIWFFCGFIILSKNVKLFKTNYERKN